MKAVLGSSAITYGIGGFTSAIFIFSLFLLIENFSKLSWDFKSILIFITYMLTILLSAIPLLGILIETSQYLGISHRGVNVIAHAIGHYTGFIVGSIYTIYYYYYESIEALLKQLKKYLISLT